MLNKQLQTCNGWQGGLVGGKRVITIKELAWNVTQANGLGHILWNNLSNGEWTWNLELIQWYITSAVKGVSFNYLKVSHIQFHDCSVASCVLGWGMTVTEQIWKWGGNNCLLFTYLILTLLHLLLLLSLLHWSVLLPSCKFWLQIRFPFIQFPLRL
jgi:hypothetical protein